jgi:hypothetical protein
MSGTEGSNPASSRGESAANPISAGQGHRLRFAAEGHFVARISSWAKSALRIDIYLRRTYSGRPSFSIRLSDATAMATSVVCRPSVRERVTNHSLVAADIGLHQRHANCNQMPAASPCGRARRSAATSLPLHISAAAPNRLIDNAPASGRDQSANRPTGPVQRMLLARSLADEVGAAVRHRCARARTILF